MRLLLYTLFRLGLVLAAAGLLYLLGLRSWVLWVVAVLVGAMVSFLVLGRQREEAAEVLAQYDPLREERPIFSSEVAADAAYEDAIVDAAAERRPSDGGAPAEGDERPRGAGEGEPGTAGEGTAAGPHRPGQDGPGDEKPRRPATP